MLKIRLRRIGAIRQPHYRIVVADARAPRDGRFIEVLGHYNPRTEPATIQVDVTKYEEWKSKGAQPTGAVERLVRQFNRTARAAEAASTPAADPRTRVASGKRLAPAATGAAVATNGNGAAAAAAAAATEGPMSEAVAEATRDDGAGSEALTGTNAAAEATEDAVLVPSETPEGAAEGDTDTDSAT